MWFGFQFNLSDSSDDDDLYRLDFDPEGQGHQWKMISIKKSSRGCLRARPDANANADADRSKTICRPPLKGVNIIYLEINVNRDIEISQKILKGH